MARSVESVLDAFTGDVANMEELASAVGPDILARILASSADDPETPHPDLDGLTPSDAVHGLTFEIPHGTTGNPASRVALIFEIFDATVNYHAVANLVSFAAAPDKVLAPLVWAEVVRRIDRIPDVRAILLECLRDYIYEGVGPRRTSEDKAKHDFVANAHHGWQKLTTAAPLDRLVALADPEMIDVPVEWSLPVLEQVADDPLGRQMALKSLSEDRLRYAPDEIAQRAQALKRRISTG